MANRRLYTLELQNGSGQNERKECGVGSCIKSSQGSTEAVQPGVGPSQFPLSLDLLDKDL